METTIQLPPDMYQAVQREAGRQQLTPDQLVTTWIASRLDVNSPHDTESIHEQFEVEAKAYARLLPQLQNTYPGQFVAILNEKVVANGDNRLALWQKVRARFGNDVVCYIEKVMEESIPTKRITSAWVR
jgi:hypothetical protein